LGTPGRRRTPNQLVADQFAARRVVKTRVGEAGFVVPVD
jgi:hypothetical protein